MVSVATLTDFGGIHVRALKVGRLAALAEELHEKGIKASSDGSNVRRRLLGKLLGAE